MAASSWLQLVSTGLRLGLAGFKFCCQLGCYNEGDRSCDVCSAPFCYGHLTLNIDDDNVLLQSLCRECYTEGVESGEVQPYEVRTADSGRAASSSGDAAPVPPTEPDLAQVVKEEIDSDVDNPWKELKTAQELYTDAAAEMTKAEADYDAYISRRANVSMPTLQQVRGIGARMRQFSGTSRKRKSSVPIKRTKSV